MKRVVLFCTALMFVITTVFAANVKKEYTVSNFQGIQLFSSPDVIVTQGSIAKVSAEGPQELIDKLEISVKNGELIIRPKNNQDFNLQTRRDYYVKIFVQVPSLNNLSISGSGDILIKNQMNWGTSVTLSIKGSGDIEVNQIDTKNLKLAVSGSGDIEVGTIQAAAVESSVQGSGDVKIKRINSTQLKASTIGSGDIEVKSGKVKEANFSVSGSGDIKAENVKADKVIASIAGSGDIKCYADQSISGKVVGSGSVTYDGKPRNVNVSKKGFKSK